MKLYSIDGFYTGSGALGDHGTTVPYGQPDKRIRVLVVDDDVQVRRLTERILDAWRFKVSCAVDIDEAVRFAAQFTPDAVLLDLQLSPDKSADGIACLYALRDRGYGGPVYVLSCDDSMEQVSKAVKGGAYGYLIKRSGPAFWRRLESLLAGTAPEMAIPVKKLCVAAVAFLETRGLSELDIQLLDMLMDGFRKEKEIARRSGRSFPAVRKNFQRIRDRLGARSQAELGSFLGMLSCFTDDLPLLRK